MVLNPVSPNEIYQIIGKLRNKNGLDDLPVKILKRVKNDISIIIACLFNLAVENSTYPEIFKNSLVTPVHKKGDKTMLCNIVRFLYSLH